MIRSFWVGAALVCAVTACGSKNRDFRPGHGGSSAGGADGVSGASGNRAWTGGAPTGGTGEGASGGASQVGLGGGTSGSGTGGGPSSLGCSSTAGQGASCGTTCQPGMYDCSSGTPVCSQTNAPAGTTC